MCFYASAYVCVCQYACECKRVWVHLNVWIPHGVEAKVLNCDIVVSGFEITSGNYAYFRYLSSYRLNTTTTTTRAPLVV